MALVRWHTHNWVAVLTMSFLCFFNLLMMAVKRKLIFFFVSPVCLVMASGSGSDRGNGIPYQFHISLEYSVD